MHQGHWLCIESGLHRSENCKTKSAPKSQGTNFPKKKKETKLLGIDSSCHGTSGACDKEKEIFTKWLLSRFPQVPGRTCWNRHRTLHLKKVSWATFDPESAMTNAIDGQGAKPVAAARICRLSASKLHHQSGAECAEILATCSAQKERGNRIQWWIHSASLVGPVSSPMVALSLLISQDEISSFPLPAGSVTSPSRQFLYLLLQWNSAI